MKLKNKCVYGVVLLFIVVFGLFNSGCRSKFSDEDVVARVGNEVLSRDKMVKQMEWEGMSPDQESQFVERWINREMLYQAAENEGILKTEELDFELQLIEKEYFIQRLLDRTFAEKIQISDTELKQYYDKNMDLFRVEEDDVKLYHILVETNQKAGMVLQELRTGKPFQDVAKEYSIGVFRDKGGDLGYVREGDLMPELSRQAFRLHENQVSSIIQSEDGFHIIKVVKKRTKGDIREFDEVRDEISRRIRVNKERMVYYDLLYNLRDKMNVYISVESSPENQSDTLVTPMP